MAMKLFNSVLVLMYLSMVCAVAGQNTDQTSSAREPVRRQLEEQRRKETEFNRLNAIKLESHKINTKELTSLSNTRLTEKDRKAIEINKEDVVKYTIFLKQPGTGIIRIYDIFNCEQNEKIYNVGDNCPSNVIGKAGSYSFRENKYNNKFLSDIVLEKSSFRSPGIQTLSVFTNLGDVELEKITLSADGVKEMAEFEPSRKKEEIKK